MALGLALTVPLIPVMVLLHGPAALELCSADVLPFAAAGILIAPVIEEVLFRGFLLGVLAKEVRLPTWVALAISSLAFGFYHDPALGGLFSLAVCVLVFTDHTVAGGFLGWACARRQGDLWLPIGFHAGLNLWIALIMPRAEVFEEHSDYERVALIQLCADTLTMTIAYLVLRIVEGRKSRTLLGAGEPSGRTCRDERDLHGCHAGGPKPSG